MDVTIRNTLATVELKELTASTDTPIDWSENDNKMTLVINAANDSKLTVKAGNGIQGVADLTVEVPKGVSVMKLESGRFKHVSGENKGKIVLNSIGAISVGTVALVEVKTHKSLSVSY